MSSPGTASIEISVEDGTLSSVVAGGISYTTVDFAPLAGFTDKPVRVSLPPWTFWRAKNLDLWSAEVGKRLSKIAETRELARRLEDFVGRASAGSLTTISGRWAADVIPWEAIGRYFQYDSSAERYRPVRLVAPERPWSLRVFEEQMRLLLVVGHEGPDADFDADEQRNRIASAISRLGKDTQTIFQHGTEIPTLSLPRQPRETWANTFKEVVPHVVIYFGHGMGGADPALRFGAGDGDWVRLCDFADEIGKVSTFPPFWIFLACSIGESPPGDHVVASPEAFRVLSERGALTMLAMRARIRVELAEIVATSVIESLAAGQSIESAAAIARYAARTSRRNTGNDLLDWAAPAVWSVGAPAQSLTWGRTGGPSSVWVCARLLRRAAADPALGLEAAPEWAIDFARRWKKEHRVRLPHRRSEPDTAFVARITAVLSAAAGRLTSKVLLVDPPPGGSFAMRLKSWAEKISAQLCPALAGAEVSGALKLMKSGDIEGLFRLLQLPDIFIVFVDPPGLSASDAVIWDQFEAASGATIIVCHDPTVEIDNMKDWSLDQLEAEDDINLDTLFGRKPQSLGLLAVLDRPLSLASLATITGETTQELEGASFLIDAPATGVVLSAGARGSVAALLGEAGLRQAHAAYLQARQCVPPRISPMDDMEDLRHLIGAELWPETAIAVNHLVEAKYREWTAADWLQLGRLLQRAGPAFGAINCKILLEIAHQLVLRQDLQDARVWLDRFDCDPLLDDARRSALLSEVFKADPAPESRAEMWKYAQRAVDQCRSIGRDDADFERARSDLRHYEQSFARLQLYFKHEASAARSKFERLMDELKPQIEDDRNAARAYIAAARNLSECLFEFHPFCTDPDLKPVAHQALDTALKIAVKHELKELAAEVAYSQAKLAEAQSRFDNALVRLQACKIFAREGGHSVCHRIADMRLYWVNVRGKGEPFDYSAFRARQTPLDFLTWHAWAARYAGQSRLWAAYRLCKDGNKADAKALLWRNLEAFEGRPDLAGSSDRRFVALSRAGLAVVENREIDSHAWADFLKLEWSGAWLEPLPSREPAAIWAGCA